eukprot:TRINITY_DN12771_c0_g1_i2.p2 TRINITY_DN12771_c0_g1~~TRINITY_DN12771_c0_g1_i2.p2  ORF type:complete len:117 (+),score=22.06 TRINITY_DN12771_c0_g1_i2:85-435(+)
MIRRPPRSTQGVSSAASDVYKRQEYMGIKSNGQIGLYGHSSEMWHSPNSPSTHSPFKLEMQSDGNLVLYSGGSKIIWASNSAGKGTAPYHLELQDDGNLVIYDKSHKAVWAIHQNI